MKTAAVVLAFPMPGNVTNSGAGRSRHWRATHREKLAYWRQLDTLQLVGQLPPPPVEPFACVALSSVMYLGHAMDDDNAMARHKPVLDWLRRRGYVANDTKKNLRWTGLPEQRVKRGQAYRIELTITPLDPTTPAVSPATTDETSPNA